MTSTTRFVTTCWRRNSRRALVALLLVVTIGLPSSAQSTKPQIQLRTLNHITLTVTDVQRSLKFYQLVFDMRDYAPQGATPRLQVGSGPQSLGLQGGGPGVAYITLGVEAFNADQVMKTLSAHGVTKSAGPSTAPMTAWVTKRGDTTELFFRDPSGLMVQLQDVSYCGGTGPLGGKCPPTPATVQPSKAPARLSTFNHIIPLVPEPEKSREFFQNVFGMKGGRVVGPGPQWMGFQKSPDGKISLDHLCFGLENFNSEGAIRRFVEFGMKLQEGDGRPQGARTEYGLGGPMRTRGFKRPPSSPGQEMPLEVFVSDPDNFQLQVNDVWFCGGDGWLGNKCK